MTSIKKTKTKFQYYYVEWGFYVENHKYLKKELEFQEQLCRMEK
jgi:hypothetical protein